jgi:hypothetical protein
MPQNDGGYAVLIHVPKLDGRTAGPGGLYPKIIDLDTKRAVVHLDILRKISLVPPTARFISLFGGKYTGEFDSHEECVAFAKGVESVLNHIVSTGNETSAQ